MDQAQKVKWVPNGRCKLGANLMVGANVGANEKDLLIKHISPPTVSKQPSLKFPSLFPTSFKS